MASLARTVDETRATLAAARRRDLTIGLVPTMGALHAGHASLIRRARQETGFVVVSIFVNPTQFGPHEDLSRYPRPIEKDLALCEREGADLIFHPAPDEIYPAGFRTYVVIHGFQDVLEGASRPGHFRGVATVVLKLFNIVKPDFAYFGQKDAQQALILQRMVRDLDVPLRLVVCPTVREADGLALSSRNAYLNACERESATILFRTLEEIRRRAAGGQRDANALIEAGKALLATVPRARLDYLDIVDAETLQALKTLSGRALAVIAVYIGNTRLIDNILLDTRS